MSVEMQQQTVPYVNVLLCINHGNCSLKIFQEMRFYNSLQCCLFATLVSLNYCGVKHPVKLHFNSISHQEYELFAEFSAFVQANGFSPNLHRGPSLCNPVGPFIQSVL